MQHTGSLMIDTTRHLFIDCHRLVFATDYNQYSNTPSQFQVGSNKENFKLQIKLQNIVAKTELLRWQY